MAFEYIGVLNSIRRPLPMVERGLRSFLRQAQSPKQIILIDQNTEKLVLSEDLRGDARLVHLHRPVPSVGMARNLVPDQPEAEWLLFCDDDGFLADDYVSEVQKILAAEPQLELLAGPYIHDTDGRYYSYRHEIGGRLDNWLGTKLMLGSNFCIRAETYNRIGRYDTRFGPGSGFPSSDETDLCWRAYEANVPMKYSDHIRVFHPPAHARDTRDAIQKAYNYGRGKGALTAKWIFERRSFLGAWEFVEMNVTPFINMARGCLRGEFRQVPIQCAVMAGRYVGLVQFLLGLKGARK